MTDPADMWERPYTLEFTDLEFYLDLFEVYAVMEHAGQACRVYLGNVLQRGSDPWLVTRNGRELRRTFATREEAGNHMANDEFDFDEREFLP